MEKEAPKTKYAWLVQQLHQLIRERAYQSDKCLPSERELCEQYDVSRITVRRALAELEEAGTIYRVQGKGAHGSAPETGVDPLTVGAYILLGLQELISREMEGIAKLSVPLMAEAKFGKSWYDAK